MTIRFLDSRKGEISNCIQELFIEAEEIYCIVAFWGRGAEKIFQDLSKKRKDKIKIVCNLSMGGTNPKMVKKLKRQGICIKHKPDLHSKVYWTEKGVIVGSANASANGLALQGGEQDGWLESAIFTDRTSTLEETRLYVQNIWCKSKRITEQDLEKAQRKWQSRRREIKGGYPLPSNRLTKDISSWEDFIEELKKSHQYLRERQKIDQKINWDVYSENNSYLHTILEGNRIFRLNSWRNLDAEQRRILRGLNNRRKEGIWGLLGEHRRLSYEVRAFKDNPIRDGAAIREKIRILLNPIINAKDNKIADMAQDILQKVRGDEGIKGMGITFTSRLLSLARPDRLVSINGKSSKGLNLMFFEEEKFEKNSQRVNYLADNYSELLRRIYQKKWFSHERPNDSLEERIWNCRAALLDALVYEELNDWIR